MVDIRRMETRLVAMVLSLITMGMGCSDAGSVPSDVDAPAAATPNYLSDRPMLSVEIRKDKVDAKKRIADIVFSKPADSKGPRVAEIFLKYSEGLKYLSSIEGSALKVSNKTLVTQTIENGNLRLVVYGADNANTIDGGVLASVTFESNTTDLNTLEILTKRPVFAPSAVNDGLLVADPVTFE